MFRPFPQHLAALFNTAMGGLADGLLRPLVGGFSVLSLLILPVNIYYFLQHSHDSATGQQLGATHPNGEWQYVQRELFHFVAAGLILWLILASFFSKPQQHLLRLCCRLVVTGVFALGVYNVYQFMMNGFPI